MLFEIAKHHGLELDEVPEYGGRAYLEKQDYIMAKQKEQLAQQEKAVQEQTVQLENLKQEHENENLLQVRRTTYQSLTIMRNDKKIQKQEKRIDELSQQIEDTENFLEEISAIAYDKAVAVVSEKAAKVSRLTARLTAALIKPEIKKPAVEKIKENARLSVLQKLQQRQEEIKQREQTRTKPKKRSHGMEL